jgi:glutaredoxin
MTNAIVDTATIPGWGIDADSRNDPTYPMRHVEDQETRGLTWTRPDVQQPDVEILQSIEHNRQPAVVGTSTPPSGVSGMIRRYAFRRSESDWMHWLLLMGADRINVVEGVIEDLAHGTIPNIPAEMGARSEWRHNKMGLAKKVGVTVALSAAAFALFRARKARSSGESGTARRIGGSGAVTQTRTAILHRMVLPEHTCPFGVRAKQLLQHHGFEVDDRILRTREEVDALKAELGVDTTPQIFIDGERIGGSDDLERWLEQA